ncbi:AAA family ATPase [Vibrio atypicus]|jgi:pilus assembly protein CpaE|uniref:AAA family ATPase n=1 Tax=Vibrio atypicus TaxID=558271 RepID=UPI001356E8D9|nr:chromosome partitioning protein ParA [Vibrio atypicus]
MLDLVELLKPSDSLEPESQSLSSVLFYQTEVCRSLVEEAFTFEGLAVPKLLENQDEVIKKHARSSALEIVIVELNESKNVTDDMRRISHLLPNSASVIVIGSEDAISTIRNLKEMGFYYLFWPVSKQELIDFVKNVSDNRSRNSGLGKARDAKKVAFWGSSGGVGTSLLVAEIACELSSKKNSSCVIVDHDFVGGNLDILLGLKKFEKKDIPPGALTASLDTSYALNMTQKITSMLSILSVKSKELDETQMKEYVRTLSDELSEQTNFLIEDLSRSVNSKVDLAYSANECDAIVLVLKPTVSSLRDASRICSLLKELETKARVIVVINHTAPEKHATVTEEEVEKYLRRPIDVICPYDGQMSKALLEGKHLHDLKLPISKSIKQITAALLGEKQEGSKVGLLSKLISRGRK